MLVNIIGKTFISPPGIKRISNKDQYRIIPMSKSAKYSRFVDRYITMINKLNDMKYRSYSYNIFVCNSYRQFIDILTKFQKTIGIFVPLNIYKDHFDKYSKGFEKDLYFPTYDEYKYITIPHFRNKINTMPRSLWKHIPAEYMVNDIGKCIEAFTKYHSFRSGDIVKMLIDIEEYSADSKDDIEFIIDTLDRVYHNLNMSFKEIMLNKDGSAAIRSIFDRFNMAGRYDSIMGDFKTYLDMKTAKGYTGNGCFKYNSLLEKYIRNNNISFLDRYIEGMACYDH